MTVKVFSRSDENFTDLSLTSHDLPFDLWDPCNERFEMQETAIFAFTIWLLIPVKEFGESFNA